jgi:drug/metabolite transporter (DMT)-like permease
LRKYFFIPEKQGLTYTFYLESDSIFLIRGKTQHKWLLFISLCLIWGSSFVLMKLGMFAADGSMLLSAWQVAALRIFSSGVVLLPLIFKAWKNIPAHLRLPVLVSGWFGSFIPAIFFCLAETKIDSALAGTLNAVTPLSTLLIGWALFGMPIMPSKLFGIGIGLLGCILLFLHKSTEGLQQPLYAGLVLLATICYGWNVNMVRSKLSGVSAIDIATLAFAGLVPFSFALLVFTGFFNLALNTAPFLKATISATLLGVLGTAIASVIFYKLVKIAGAVFASLVTYGIPFVALGWGLLYGEKISLMQLMALGIILVGVYVTGRENMLGSRSPKIK